jgi:hypothetical protein
MKKGSEVLYLGTIFAGGNGAAGERLAATTVLWPFAPALDEAYKQFLIEDAKNRELKAKQEAEAKAVAELKAKQEAEAEAAAELKAKQEAEAKASATKKTVITCVKGKITKKVSAVKPKCPTGYKKK